ncbi:hypothetical protein GA0111570_105277 [Raineyella antarctica]|uniref:Uncharacterized protein n=1 Tax=Raineyella antarctica TaxID=1577474 RepID=A0A1G6GYD3_9ACTN|nr:hypothetical protein GA0111570_105277 [Raineyella antarctica]
MVVPTVVQTSAARSVSGVPGTPVPGVMLVLTEAQTVVPMEAREAPTEVPMAVREPPEPTVVPLMRALTRALTVVPMVVPMAVPVMRALMVGPMVVLMVAPMVRRADPTLRPLHPLR